MRASDARKELEAPPSLTVEPGVAGFHGTLDVIKPVPVPIRVGWLLAGPGMAALSWAVTWMLSDELAGLVAVAGLLFGWLGAGWGVSVWRDVDDLVARLDGVRLTLDDKSWSLAEIDEVGLIRNSAVTRVVVRSGRKRYVLGFERPHHAAWLRDAILKAMSRLEGEEADVPDDLHKMRDRTTT